MKGGTVPAAKKQRTGSAKGAPAESEPEIAPPSLYKTIKDIHQRQGRKEAMGWPGGAWMGEGLMDPVAGENLGDLLRFRSESGWGEITPLLGDMTGRMLHLSADQLPPCQYSLDASEEQTMENFKLYLTSKHLGEFIDLFSSAADPESKGVLMKAMFWNGNLERVAPSTFVKIIMGWQERGAEENVFPERDRGQAEELAQDIMCMIHDSCRFNEHDDYGNLRKMRRTPGSVVVITDLEQFRSRWKGRLPFLDREQPSAAEDAAVAAEALKVPEPLAVAAAPAVAPATAEMSLRAAARDEPLLPRLPPNPTAGDIERLLLRDEIKDLLKKCGITYHYKEGGKNKMYSKHDMAVRLAHAIEGADPDAAKAAAATQESPPVDKVPLVNIPHAVEQPAAAEAADDPIVARAKEREIERRRGGRPSAAAAGGTVVPMSDAFGLVEAGSLFDRPRKRRQTKPGEGDMGDLVAQQELADGEIIEYQELLAIRPAYGGSGLFAKRALKKGDVTLRYFGEIYASRREYSEALQTEEREGGYLMETKHGFFDGDKIDQFAKYVNHRTNPSPHMKFVGTKDTTDYVRMELVKSVKAGEQIFADYGGGYDYRAMEFKR